jgi:hypothetical protein
MIRYLEVAAAWHNHLGRDVLGQIVAAPGRN